METESEKARTKVPRALWSDQNIADLKKINIIVSVIKKTGLNRHGYIYKYVLPGTVIKRHVTQRSRVTVFGR